MPERLDELFQSSILIVDDEPANVMLLDSILADEGYQNIVSTMDPRQVVDLHRTHDYDLILLDIRMPHMSGIEVLHALSENFPGQWCPVIVLTAQTDDQTRQGALEAGARDFVNKPFKSWEVLLRIRNTLETRLYYRRQMVRADILEEEVRQRTKQIYDTKLMVLESLGRASEYRDYETGNHVVRVGTACEMLALDVGIAPHRAELIRNASPMHDVGKIGIPDTILLKPGKLDPAEREIMNQHVQIGADIVGDDADELLMMARLMALCHHEKWDGTGYPKGLRGEEIPLEARIASICDVFDALTSSRPYKTAWTSQDALDYVNAQSGLAFDPHLVQAFNRIAPDIIALRDRLPD